MQPGGRVARIARHLVRLSFLLSGLAVACVAAWLWLRPEPPAPPPEPLPPLTGTIDRILIEKAARRLTVFREGAALRSYAVALGSAPEGAKTRQGDGRTPEGTFMIDRRNPQSAFHLSLGIDYPQGSHVAAARAAGHSAGGDIFIHGQPNRLPDALKPRTGDWTDGCIAVTDAEMEELWRITRIGTEVEIRP